jgi:hypothetical protein
MVMVAMTTGITTPKNAKAFLKPVLCKNALPHVVNTKEFIHNWMQPAKTPEPTKKFVKFATPKNKSPVSPYIAIQFEVVLMELFLLKTTLMLKYK